MRGQGPGGLVNPPEAGRDRYIAFDVETPNSRSDRMSAVGVCVVEGGAVIREFYTLVDPETVFHPFNMALTGITPELVRGRPTFPEVWETLAPLFDSGLLLAHNAPFDLSVLAKCLRDYGIFWKAAVPYACTCQMGRRLFPYLPDHKLNTMCAHFGVALDHHHAGSDSRACGELLLRCLDAAADITPFVRRYDLLRICTVPAAAKSDF